MQDTTGALVVPGSFPIHDLDDIGISLPAGQSVTVAGLVLEHLGHLPDAGEHVIVDRYDIEIATVDQRSLSTVRNVAPATEPNPGDGLMAGGRCWLRRPAQIGP